MQKMTLSLMTEGNLAVHNTHRVITIQHTELHVHVHEMPNSNQSLVHSHILVRLIIIIKQKAIKVVY